jgi:hypothetical protein
MKTTQENFIGQIGFDRFQRNSETARTNNHEHWIGDIPVRKEMVAFFKAFKDKRYNIVPCVDKSSTVFWKRDAEGESIGISIYDTISITFPDATDFRSGNLIIAHDGSGDMQYCVESKKIENEKYACTSDGYNIRQSKDLKKALKIAMTYLKPLGYDDVLNNCRDKLSNGIENLRSPAREKLHERLSVQRSDMAQEVAHMIASGYVPSTKAFKDAVDLITQEGAELRRMQDYKPRACFVWVKPNSLSYRFTDETQVTECTSMDDVPEFVRNKLAVLQIAKNGDAITDVGIRVSDITYWVFA